MNAWIRRFSCGGTAAFLSLSLSGCGIIDDGLHQPAHLCPAGFNSDWTGVPGLSLEHTDPRVCPVPFVKGQQVWVGGSIVEGSATFPDPGEIAFAHLRAWELYFPFSFSGIDLLGSKTQFFSYPDLGGSWMTQIFLSYTFGNNPDWLEFEVVGAGGQPKAYLEMHNGGPELANGSRH